MTVAKLFKNRFLLFFAFIILAIVFSLPFFIHPFLSGILDWDMHYMFIEVPKRIILNYHQFPLWNPYRCGGWTEIGNPENRFLSPFFLLFFFYDTVIGYKLLLPAFIFIGLLGMYKFAGYLNLKTPGSILAAILYSCTGLMVLPFKVGMTNYMTIAFIPWISYFYFKAIKETKGHIKNAVITAVLVVLMFFFGFNYIPIIFLYLFVLSLPELYRSKKFTAVKIFIYVLICFVSLSAVKLIPSFEALLNFPRAIVNPRDGYSVQSLLFSLFSRNQTFDAFSELYLKSISFWKGYSYDFDENGMYVGIISGLLFAWGILKSKKNRIFILIAAIFLWLMFGNRIHPSLYALIRKFPFLDNTRVAMRFRYIFMLYFAIFAGTGLDYFRDFIRKYFKNKWSKIVTVLLIITITGDIWIVNSITAKGTFNRIPLTFPNQAQFTQTGIIKSDNSENLELSLIRANIGSSDLCYEAMPVVSYVAKPFTPEYQGEYYFLNNDGIATQTEWTPNYLAFNLNNLSDKSVLVVNQNYDRSWWAMTKNFTFRRVTAYNHLISVKLNKGDENLIIFYLPISFIIGLVSTLTATIYFIKKFRNSD